MSLYGNDDSNANKTKAGIGIGASSQAKTVVFIDDTEAQLKSNKDRGLNAHLAGGRILHTPTVMVRHAIRQSNSFTCLLYTSPSPRDTG